MRRGALLVFLLLALVGPALAASRSKEPTVGPNDGKVVESLAPVPTPTAIITEKMPETALAETAEKAGDYTTSLVEWQRIAYEFNGADRAKALFRAAKAQIKLGQPAAAGQTLQIFLKEFPTHDLAPQARYHLVLSAGGPARVEALAMVANQPILTPWDQAALYSAVYAEALATGHVTKTYGLEEAATLQTRMKMLAQQNTARKATASTLSLIPGIGLIFLNRNAQGGMLLTIWALFGLAFLSACRHRQYAYAFLLSVPFAALWLTAPGNAAAIADERAVAERKAAMPTWPGLQPHEPVEEQAAQPLPPVPQAPLAPPLAPIVPPADVSLSAALISASSLTPQTPGATSAQ